jgi:hypothetical protein
VSVTCSTCIDSPHSATGFPLIRPLFPRCFLAVITAVVALISPPTVDRKPL